MKQYIVILSFLLLSQNIFADSNSSLSYYTAAQQELQDMLAGKQPLSYERAIFIIENAYNDNTLSYTGFQAVLDNYTTLIKDIRQASGQTYIPKADRSIFEMARRSDEQVKADFERALSNWAIYTYLTDTTLLALNDSLFLVHLPYYYSAKDPMGTSDWMNTQVTNLLYAKQGNCFALASLFKIFADRLQSNAALCTAPSHIYITHKDENGTAYNVELASRSFPGSGTLETLTYTTGDATKNGIALRTLNDTQAIALCLVYLAKGYEYKYHRQDDFMLQCAETALKYDSHNLNALLLQAELLQNKVQQKNKPIAQLQTDLDFKQYENLIGKLYTLGYREMPIDMKNLLVKGWTQDTIELYLNNYLVQNKDETRKASLSWGLFEEEHKYKPIEQYGQTMFDCKTKKIKGFTKEKLLYNDYNFDPVVFAWNVDPLTHKYPSMSPYMAFADNPIFFVDLDGRKFSIPKHLDETNAATYLSDIQGIIGNTNYNNLLIHNNETGEISFDVSKVPESDRNVGMQLLSDMVKAKEKYLYEIDASMVGINRKNGSSTSAPIYPMYDDEKKVTSNKAAANLSITQRGDYQKNIKIGNSVNRVDAYDALPKDGYDGLIVVTPDVSPFYDVLVKGNNPSPYIYDKVVNESRSSLLLHEALENYYRTSFGLTYEQAHYNATEDEKCLPNGHPAKGELPGGSRATQPIGSTVIEKK